MQRLRLRLPERLRIPERRLPLREPLLGAHARARGRAGAEARKGARRRTTAHNGAQRRAGARAKALGAR